MSWLQNHFDPTSRSFKVAIINMLCYQWITWARAQWADVEISPQRIIVFLLPMIRSVIDNLLAALSLNDTTAQTCDIFFSQSENESAPAFLGHDGRDLEMITVTTSVETHHNLLCQVTSRCVMTHAAGFIPQVCRRGRVGGGEVSV